MISGMSQRQSDGEGDAEVLLRLAEATAHAVGVEFFGSLVRHLCEALGAPYAFVAEFADSPSRVRSLAYFADGALQENFEYDLAGTPCEAVARGDICHHPRGVAAKFPADPWSAEIGARGHPGGPPLGRAGARPAPLAPQ